MAILAHRRMPCKLSGRSRGRTVLSPAVSGRFLSHHSLVPSFHALRRNSPRRLLIHSFFPSPRRLVASAFSTVCSIARLFFCSSHPFGIHVLHLLSHVARLSYSSSFLVSLLAPLPRLPPCSPPSGRLAALTSVPKNTADPLIPPLPSPCTTSL